EFARVVYPTIIYIGAYTGFAMSCLDPLTTRFAQQLAGVPLFSGAPECTVMFIITLIVTMIYVIWYSKRIKRDQHAGILGSQPFPKDSGDTELGKTERTTTHSLGLLSP